jgi:hypothetical protein
MALEIATSIAAEQEQKTQWKTEAGKRRLSSAEERVCICHVA